MPRGLRGNISKGLRQKDFLVKRDKDLLRQGALIRRIGPVPGMRGCAQRRTCMRRRGLSPEGGVWTTRRGLNPGGGAGTGRRVLDPGGGAWTWEEGLGVGGGAWTQEEGSEPGRKDLDPGGGA